MKKLSMVTFLAAVVMTVAPASAVEYTSLGDISVGFDGYYRVRGEYFGYKDPTGGPGATRDYVGRTVDYFDMRLRLEVELKFSEKVRMVTEFNGLTNVVWGKNAGGNILTQSVTNHSHRTYPTSPESPQGYQNAWFQTDKMDQSFELTRVFGEVKTPFGLFRFGRMPSNWGLGLLSSDGTDLDDDHGDTYDRLLFATKPFGGEDSKVTVALLYSQIATGKEPMAFEDDIQEFVLVPYYKDGDKTFFGAYLMYRHQSKNGGQPPDLTSKATAFIGDLYGKFHFDPWYLEFETLAGTAAFDVYFGAAGAAKDVKGFAWNGAVKGGYDPEGYRVGAEFGWQLGANAEDNLRPGVSATGTPTMVGDKFSTLGFDADYRFDLIMFREAFAQATATMGAFWPLDDSFGSCNNAMYVKLDGDYDITPNLMFTGALIYGSVIEPDIYKTPTWNATTGRYEISDQKIATDLGFELDASAWYTFNNRFKMGALLGYFASGGFFSDAYDYLGSRVTDDDIFTAQTKMWVMI